MELAAGTVVDRYVVDQVLGEGGMAVVYLCNHTQLGTQHALKVLTISSRAIRERLVQEGQVQAQLRHPNIVAVTDIVMINGAPGLVMEYIDGPSVDDLLEDRTLSYEQVDVLAEGILTGVAHAHAQGLVHRDLKPANIMLAVRGSSLVPKVTDFGLAKLLDSDTNRAATRTGSTMGTPHYMSPEQVSDSKNVDHRTDVFALGAVLYEMVAGQRAFSGDNLLQLFSAAAKGRYTPIRELKPDIPDRMEAAIHGALEPDRDKRIQSAEDLLAIWKGEKLRGMGKQAEVPAGPFDAAFLKSVKSISSLSSGSSSSPDPTWNPGAGAEVVHVESVFKAAPVPLAPAPRVDAVSSSSLVSGKSLVVGGGAAMLFAGGIGVVSVIVVGALGFWWANRPAEPRQVTRLEDRVQPISDPASRVPGPIPEVGPVPGPGGVQPVAEPISTAPSQAPQLVAPVGPVPTVVVPAQPDPMEPTEPDPGEPPASVRWGHPELVGRLPGGSDTVDLEDDRVSVLGDPLRHDEPPAGDDAGHDRPPST